MTQTPIRVLLVDDQQLLRHGLTLLLSTVPTIEVVAEAAHGAEALAVLNTRAVDVVVTDAKMPVMDGIELVQKCATQYPNIPVLVLTTFDEPYLVRGAIAAGAAGFLLKDTSTDGLADAIAAVVGGGLVIDPRVARLAMEPAATSQSNEPNALAILTRAERAVAELLAEGASNTAIASQLHLAEGTVKNHVSALLRKLQATDRTALALTLYKSLHEQ